MPEGGWQQAPIPLKRRCGHITLPFAYLSINAHAEGHEWVCPACGQVFVVVSNAGENKKLVPKERTNNAEIPRSSRAKQ